MSIAASNGLAGSSTRAVRLVETPTRAGVRLLCELDPERDRRYTALVARVAPAVERALPPSAMANRVAAASVRSGLVELEPWRPARARFAAAARRMSDARALVVADVHDCFPSIRPDVVASCVERVGARLEAAAIRELLADLERSGVRGLPVGPAPSAVLANAVLAVVDDALAARGAHHLRWVDDVWVPARDVSEARRLLAVIGDALGRVGLELAPAKTRVVDGPQVAAVLGGGRVSAGQYHRPADADPVPGVARPHVVVPADG